MSPILFLNCDLLDSGYQIITPKPTNAQIIGGVTGSLSLREAAVEGINEICAVGVQVVITKAPATGIDARDFLQNRGFHGQFSDGSFNVPAPADRQLHIELWLQRFGRRPCIVLDRASVKVPHAINVSVADGFSFTRKAALQVVEMLHAAGAKAAAA